MAFSPWLKGGRKLMDADGDPMLCEKCPCACEICDRLALNPPDGFTRGWFFEVTGIPCGSSCTDPPQTFALDYTEYHAANPGWQTCAWMERDGSCVAWFAVNPRCEVVMWAHLQDCESSSSGSSSSGSSSSASSSSILDYDCICQAYREDPAVNIYYATTGCDTEEPPPFGPYTWQQLWDMYISQGGLLPPLDYDRFCGAAKYTRPTNEKVITDIHVDFFDYEDKYDGGSCIRHWYARMIIWHLEVEKGIGIDDPCDESQFPQEDAEDDLI